MIFYTGKLYSYIPTKAGPTHPRYYEYIFLDMIEVGDFIFESLEIKSFSKEELKSFTVMRKNKLYYRYSK